jgi:O-antigen ligase
VALAVIVFLGGLTGIYLLARPVIEARYETTRMQIADIRTHGNVGAREQLYSDTWRMAREKPWFGWGLGSYALVFQTFNQQLSAEGWVPFYAQAHSDWLQILAEVGAIGSLLLILLVLAPLSAALRSGRPGALAACLLAGCALLMVYAMVEFPFANPAVLIAFWTCFFAAIRYHQLSTDSGVP